jgi:adenylate cyclase
MDDVHLKRRLTAVLLADVVGYSRLMSADEEGTHVRLAERVRTLIEPAIAEHHGRPVRSMGDGMLVEFDSAVDAVRCATDIQRGLAAREQEGKERRIQLRIGVNTGDVIVDERDIYGNSINIAARLEGLAEPGQIYVTRSVRDQLRGYPDITFEDKGEHRVKNIDRPIRVFRVGYDEKPRAKSAWQRLAARFYRPLRSVLPQHRRATALAAGMLLAGLAVLGMTVPPGWFSTVAPPPRNSIVVMPFNNFSGDTRQSYVADALTDDVTTDLARLKGIFVIAPSTAFTFKGRSVDAREVGRECNVHYLLEGSIVRVGNKIATNVQLIDTETGGNIWADHFQTDISDLIALQEAVTGRIAASLDIQLAQAERERALHRPVADPDAVDLRFRAMAMYISGITPEHTREARLLLEQSVQLDPNSAEAWAELANLVMIDYLRSWNNANSNNILLAERAVQKAYAIDRSVALAHVADGEIREVEGDLQGEVDALNEALAWDRNFAVAYARKANTLILLGRAQQAPELLTKAVQLSPRDPDLGMFYWFMGRAYFNVKKYPEAIQWLQKSVRERPSTWFSWAHLISAYALTGRLGEPDARAALAEYRQRFKRNWSLDPNIRHYYTQAKYRGAPPELQASLQEYFRGLEIAKQTAGFP